MIVFRSSNYGCCESDEVINIKTGRELKQKTKKEGYKEVCLYIEGRSKSFYVHRIVAECFLENKRNKPEVNHLDGDKSNNNYLNLEWCTSSENQIHSFRSGLQLPTILMGSDNGLYKGVIMAKNLITGEEFSIRALTDCRRFGFNQGRVSQVINKKEKSHKSHIFWRKDNAE